MGKWRETTEPTFQPSAQLLRFLMMQSSERQQLLPVKLPERLSQGRLDQESPLTHFREQATRPPRAAAAHTQRTCGLTDGHNQQNHGLH